jgi:hypothetical protein
LRYTDAVRVVPVLLVMTLMGCGGDGSAGAPTTTQAPPTEPVATGLPNLGCDVVAQCLPEFARSALERCPASRLNARGRQARRRLEKLLDQIDAVDLHNKQADLASPAAMGALTELEQQCL